MVNDHYLVVVPDQFAGGARDCNSGLEKSHFELAQTFLAAMIYAGDQCVDSDAAGYGILQRLLKLAVIETKDRDINTLLCVFYCGNQRRYAVVGLDDKFHVNPPWITALESVQ